MACSVGGRKSLALDFPLGRGFSGIIIRYNVYFVNSMYEFSQVSSKKEIVEMHIYKYSIQFSCKPKQQTRTHSETRRMYYELHYYRVYIDLMAVKEVFQRT